MDCFTARQHLDCLHEGCNSPVEDDVANRQAWEHLEHCEACQQYMEECRYFDRRFYSTLMSSSVPNDLESRLLAALDDEIAVAPQVRQSTESTWSLRKVGMGMSVVAALLMVVLGLFFMRSTQTPLDYADAGQTLASRFVNSDPDHWQQLAVFDGSFDLKTSQRDLRRFRLSPAHGLDLGGSSAQDAAVFRFAMKNWSGILTVLPTDRFVGVPEMSTPRVQSGRRALHWQSADGKLTYICFVHQGSVSGLAHELFGRLA